jgi:hypothetical protein
MEVKKKIIKFCNLWLPPLLWAGLIFKFSMGSIPVASPVYWQDFVFKKSGHVILFATLAILVYRALIGENVDRKKAAILATIIALFYGATDEFHQMFTQGREARIRDVVIDGFGGGIVMSSIYSFVSKLPKPLREILLKIGIK